MKNAQYQETLKNGNVKCTLCPKYCELSEGQVGVCKTRKVINAQLMVLNYGCVLAMAVDPVEKKPLYHFYPGTDLFSVGTFGCNLDCEFCQNHTLVHCSERPEITSPELLVEQVIHSGAKGIAFTYNEPIVWYEYVLAVSKLAKSKGLMCVLVTNGMINEAPLRALLPYIDAVNIDLKSSQGSFYAKWCSGDLVPVLNTIGICALEVHTEITNLLIHPLNTNRNAIVALCCSLADINPCMPLHFSRYFPAHRLMLAPTPVEEIELAASIAKQYLKYVYIGNVSYANIDSYCTSCGELLVKRTFRPVNVLMDGNHCAKCGHEHYFVV